MKGILEFELPEERSEFNLTCKAIEMHIVISEFRNWIRQRFKHCDLPEDRYEELEVVERAWNDICERLYEFD